MSRWMAFQVNSAQMVRIPFPTVLNFYKVCNVYLISFGEKTSELSGNQKSRLDESISKVCLRKFFSSKIVRALNATNDDDEGS